ncbi:MAG: plasmid pRiA4b ORF-3 family protein [Rhodobacteraceae bacterium]|nr:plasmid pRiA4b ORF-3 family protein [Paracoccaceae bacterium]
MSEPVVRVRIELEGTAPLVWRDLDLPLSTTLAALHDLIQVVMRWQDYHLHEFEVGEKVYGVPDPEDAFEDRKVYQEKSIRLGNLIERGVREFLYVYDFGDNWRHAFRSRISVKETSLSNIPASLQAPGARRQRTSAAHRASRSFSKRWRIPNMKTMRQCSSGMGRPSIPTTSTNDISA